MPDDPRMPDDAKLSEADVKRVLERAVQIDSARTDVSVSDVTQAAREAGISERAVMQAVQELLEGREVVTTAAPGTTTSVAAHPASAAWLRTAAAFGLFVVALLGILTVVRLLFP